ncbi:MAG: hypothetical protein ACEQSB_04375 [Undibacterium sp.]
MGKRVVFFVTAFLFSLALLSVSVGLTITFAYLSARWMGYQAPLSQVLMTWFVMYGLPLWLLQGRFVPNATISARVTLYVIFPVIIALLLAPFEPLKALLLLSFVTMEPFYRLLDRTPLRAR